ncbi:arabinose ABC transporter permease [Aureimonas ureilytica]|uniref:Arabinose ABC transporter permease n=1 Tax=Aureimonas ureilytica TaxID=401562 RepID=A0A175REN5_9HYPH|nr:MULTISPECIES: MFS transporter [Aureimonas]KTQ97811.1 arabinose ABC transporter permease [Aureimonas ureilytica]KTR06946.1 arabinose ABC transporter permease [Aureimonas ureilytica]
MSANSAAAAPSAFERDARAANAHHGEIRPSEIAIGVLIGRTAEFFDFFVYAIASVLVFPAVVFSFADPVTGTYYAFALLALAFVVRPIGTAFFTWMHRRYGDAAKLTTALFLLGCSTIVIGFLPAYASVGTASVVTLIVLRVGQGLALGGTWDGLAPLLAVSVPENKRGWYAMLPQLGAPLGLLVASALYYFLITNLTQDDFLGWGWRYPFFVAFAVNVVALFARLRIVVTENYREMFERGELHPSPVRQTIARNGRNIVIGAFVPLASFALFHMVTVFPLSWIHLNNEPVSRFLLIEIIATVFGVVAHIASGPLADHYGRRRVLGVCAGAIAFYSCLAPLLLNGGTIGETIYMIIGSVILGISFGQCSGALAANFPRSQRYTGSALTSDLAWLFGAGFAPLAALAIAQNLGLVFSGAYLLSGAVVTLLALLVNRRLAASAL